MRKPTIYVWILAALASTAPRVGAAPLPDEPRSPVELRLRFDRESYLVNEPVFVEWTITNVSRAPIYLPRIRRCNVGYECRNAWGQSIDLDYAIPCGCGKIDIIELQPDRSERGWCELWRETGAYLERDDYRQFEAPGQFTFQASFSSAYYYENIDEHEVFTARSNAVAIRIVTPTGADAKASAIFPRPGHYREHLEKLSGGKILQPVLQTKSARFGAATAFYGGFYEFRSTSTERERLLKTCMQSDAASPYLKGLTMYHLLRHQSSKSTDAAAQQEAIHLAEYLLAKFPDTYMADQARAILDRLLSPPNDPSVP